MYDITDIKDEETLAMIKEGWKVCKICGVLFKKLDESKFSEEEREFCGRLCYKKHKLLQGIIVIDKDEEYLSPTIISRIQRNYEEEEGEEE